MDILLDITILCLLRANNSIFAQKVVPQELDLFEMPARLANCRNFGGSWTPSCDCNPELVGEQLRDRALDDTVVITSLLGHDGAEWCEDMRSGRSSVFFLFLRLTVAKHGNLVILRLAVHCSHRSTI